MSGERVRRLVHSAEVAAPAEAVYALLANAVRGPLYSPGVLHVERMDADGDRERLRVWEHSGGGVRCSLWARVAHPQERRIEFWQLRGEAPITSMAGQWTIQEAAGGRSVVSVLHEFTVAGDPLGAEAVRAALAVKDNARSTLRSVRRIARSTGGWRQRVLTFQESLRVQGPGEVVYDFLYRATDWAGRVPQVRHVDVSEVSPGVQAVNYRLRLPDRTERATSSLRLCFPHAGRIVYKQTTPWAPVAAHTGEWSVLPDEHGVRVIAEHTVLLDEHALPGGEYAMPGRECTQSSGADTELCEASTRPSEESSARVPAGARELRERQRPEPAPLPEAGWGQERPARRPAGQGPVPEGGGVRGLVRDAIGQASRAILEQAGRHAESAVQALPQR
ncbi:SRPBCC family protein [Streptomyces sp. NPDC005227]|uniref:SRPBCC family protein n=1 Tax=unclassified Streptomyces TaxID=2593676 RepID=UPI003693DADD